LKAFIRIQNRTIVQKVAKVSDAMKKETESINLKNQEIKYEIISEVKAMILQETGSIREEVNAQSKAILEEMRKE